MSCSPNLVEIWSLMTTFGVIFDSAYLLVYFSFYYISMYLIEIDFFSFASNLNYLFNAYVVVEHTTHVDIKSGANNKKEQTLSLIWIKLSKLIILWMLKQRYLCCIAMCITSKIDKNNTHFTFIFQFLYVNSKNNCNTYMENKC